MRPRHMRSEPTSEIFASPVGHGELRFGPLLVVSAFLLLLILSVTFALTVGRPYVHDATQLVSLWTQASVQH